MASAEPAGNLQSNIAEVHRAARLDLLPVFDLPDPPTKLIGRVREVAEIRELILELGVRMVTLTGPGGIGKTRLAIAAASGLDAEFPDGIRFVDLTPIENPSAVLPEIAQRLGVRDFSDQSLVAGVRAFLRGRRMLIVLDNFERVLDAAPVIGECLSGIPGVVALVTSRALLRLSIERAMIVPPLGLPNGHHERTVAKMLEYESVRLFVERAGVAQPGFTLTEANAEIVADISLRLDGLPLALELAAARMRVLPAAALLQRLERRLPLLTDGPRDVPARQQTLRRAIAWSYDLLAPNEQTLFRRLSVFVGGFTLEAAEAVVDQGLPAKADQDDLALPSPITYDLSTSTLDGIASLVDKSLLRRIEVGGDDVRYGMLETVREFGLEQLTASREEAATRRAHADWCTTQAEATWEGFHAQADAGWLDRMEADHDNARSALAWLEQTGDAEGLVRLAGALWPFWHRHSHRRDGHIWLTRALDPARIEHVSGRLCTRALYGAAYLARNRGDYDQATLLATECLFLAGAIEDRQAESRAHQLLAFIVLAKGEYKQAAMHASEALVQSTALGERSAWTAWVQSDLGMAAFGDGDLSRAQHILRETLVLYEHFGDPFGSALTLGYLGLVATGIGQFTDAAACFTTGLPLWQEMANLENQAEWLAGVATLAAAYRMPERASTLFGAADKLRDTLGHTFTLPERAAFERGLDSARGALGAQAFDTANQAGRLLPLDQAIVEATDFLTSLVNPPENLDHGAEPNKFQLTARELEVLQLMADGFSDKEIAETLFIGVRTAQGHASAIMSKLGVRNRTSAATVALAAGLVARAEHTPSE